MGVQERNYTTRLRQHGAFIPSQHIPSALTEALHAAICRLIEQDHVLAQDCVYLGLSSNRLSHTYNYRGLTANKWLRGGAQVEALLQQMSAMLNSNEQFKMDDFFQLSFTHVIKNGDELCCARAIVTAKARLDQHPNWDGFKRGRRIQAVHAVDLHHEMRVPEVHVGTTNSKPSLYDYQILLCDATQLVLLYDDSHYDVITSLPGFFGTSYFYARCLKPYNNQGHHACDNNPDHCSPCLQTACPDYTKAQGQLATSRVLRVSITSKPCRISASFKWLRLPRMNGRNVAPNEDLVVVCMVLLPAWPPCTPMRMMCPPLLFFLHLLWTVSTSMTKNLCYTYSSTWRPCRTQDVTFRILSWPKPRTTSVQSASGETRACATS